MTSGAEHLEFRVREHGEVAGPLCRLLQAEANKKRKRIIDFFRVFDADASGSVTYAELRRGLTAVLGWNVPPELFRRFCAELDASGDGEVQYKELERAVKRSDPKRREQEEAVRLAAAARAARAEADAATKARAQARLAEDRVAAQARGLADLRRKVAENGGAALLPVARLIKQHADKKGLRVLDIFRKCDTDGSGQLSYAELRAGLALVLGFELPDDLHAGLCAEFDKDGDGDVDYRELHRAVRRFFLAERSTPPRTLLECR